MDRFEAEQAPGHVQNAAFQKQRRWEKMQKLRAEAKVWLTELENREHTYRRALQALVAPKEAVDKDPKDEFQPARWNPFRWTRVEQINFAVTYGLTAIGLCLMLGLCTRLAALGGAAFMLFVVMTQPAWPGLFPPDPAVVGHALLINKDFIEMLSLLVVASTPVGRWGGLDYFLHHLVVHPFLSKTVGPRQEVRTSSDDESDSGSGGRAGRTSPRFRGATSSRPASRPASWPAAAWGPSTSAMKRRSARRSASA